MARGTTTQLTVRATATAMAGSTRGRGKTAGSQVLASDTSRESCELWRCAQQLHRNRNRPVDDIIKFATGSCVSMRWGANCYVVCDISVRQRYWLLRCACR